MKCSWVEPRLSEMTLSTVDQRVEITHLRKCPFRGCESMGSFGAKALLLGFCSSGSQDNHLSLQVYFSEFSRLPDPASLMSYHACPSPKFCSGTQGLGLCWQARSPFGLHFPIPCASRWHVRVPAADCELQGRPSLLLCLGLLCTTAH